MAEWERVEERSFSVPSRTVTDVVFLGSGDASWVMVDHHIRHTFPWPDGTYEASHINTIAAREGKIVYVREYVDTLALARATGTGHHAPSPPDPDER